MAVDIKTVKPGDVLNSWWDTGAMGPDLMYFVVLKVGAKKIKVQAENGVGTAWKYPFWFNEKVRDAELIDEVKANVARLSNA
jgi:hypothetical protein